MSAPVNLRYDMLSATDAGETRHPQEVMRALGIAYAHATPQSMADQWWFWRCTGVPDKLQPYLELLGIAPRDAIGHGLSAEGAERLSGPA